MSRAETAHAGARPATAHVVSGRVVYTYSPDGWPAGLVTGFAGLHGAFHIEHVCVFPQASPGALLRMARLGIEEAWAQGYTSLVYGVPRAFPLSPALARLGERLGFVQYAADQTDRYFVLYRGEK
jgi:hypothetical protein